MRVAQKAERSVLWAFSIGHARRMIGTSEEELLAEITPPAGVGG